jgi:hypothetical protein
MKPTITKRTATPVSNDYDTYMRYEQKVDAKSVQKLLRAFDERLTKLERENRLSEPISKPHPGWKKDMGVIG